MRRKKIYSVEELRECAEATVFYEDAPPRIYRPPPVIEPPKPKRWLGTVRGGPVCYFIGGAEGPIKIGYSRDVNARLAKFQLGSPVALDILAITPGGEAQEAIYHARFEAHRLHGEWFNRAPEIIAEIDKLVQKNQAGVS